MNKILYIATFMLFHFLHFNSLSAFMPSHGVYFNDQEFDAVAAAAAMSPEASISPYIAAAVRQRMKTEGIAHDAPKVALWSAIEEIGVDKALEILTAKTR